MKIKTSSLVLILMIFCGSGNFSHGELLDLGFRGSAIIPAEHLREWVEHANEAREKAGSLSKDNPTFSQGSVSFISEKSLELKEGKLIALNYYMTFKVKAASSHDDNTLYNKELSVLSPTAIRYNLVTKTWSLVENPVIIQKSNSFFNKDLIETE